MKPFDIEQIDFRHRLQNVIQRAYEETMVIVQSMPMSHDEPDNDAKSAAYAEVYAHSREVHRLKDVIRIHENTIKNQSEMLTQNAAQHKRDIDARCQCTNLLDSLRDRYDKLIDDHDRLTKSYEILSTRLSVYKQSVKHALESLL